jgi:hypothetical protein
MPFGLGKSEKQPDQEGDPQNEDALEGALEATAVDTEDDDPSPAYDPPAAAQAQEENSGAMAFRPSFLDSDTPGERAPAAPQVGGDAFFISVARDDGSDIHCFDGPVQAQAFVEQLLEEGVPEENVTAFSGRRVSLKVTHRPVVKLVTSQDE